MSDDIGDPIGERPVSKLSEIKARPACLCNWNPPSEKDYLLDLVKRLGKALCQQICPMCDRTLRFPQRDCDSCKGARALLLEVKE